MRRQPGEIDPNPTKARSSPRPDPVVPADPAELPIDGTLDLHTFAPSEVRPLLEDYLEACRDRGILLVRVIHGKGTGHLRESVHRALRRLPCIIAIEWPVEGNWGATVVRLRPQDAP